MTSPSVGRSISAIILSSVDLPAPLCPMIPRDSPLRTVSDTLSSALNMRYFSLPRKNRTTNSLKELTFSVGKR